MITSVERYLDIRRALGYDLEETESFLRSFAEFASDLGETRISSRTAIAWAGEASTQSRRDRRLKAVVRSARFLRAEDERHEIPPEDIFYVKRHRPIPYIFTDEEIKRLVSVAARIGVEGSLRPHTYSTLFALLAVTGMRISEALSLKLEDFTKDGLVIRNTKFKKNRLVPLHETSKTAIQNYLDHRCHIAGNDDHLFISQSCQKLSYHNTVKTFRRVCNDAGLPLQGEPRRLRFHDLRHTFAVRALETCSATGKSITRHMLALSTYMGHASIRSNYWYLESTPQLMAGIATACESFMKGEPS